MKKSKGFTLIELLVVIAIIGILSSVVFASLRSIRANARDVAIKAAMTEVSNLMALNYNDYNSYCQIEPGVWVPGTGYTCDTLLSSGKFSGTYAQKARDLCQNIYDNARDDSIGNRLLISVGVANQCVYSYSWAAYLNNGKWYCNGSSGAKGEYPQYNGYPGCWDNP